MKWTSLVILKTALACLLPVTASIGAAADRITLGPANENGTRASDCLIFTVDEPLELKLRVQTDVARVEGRRLTFEVRDFWGTKVDAGEVSIRRSSAGAIVTFAPKVPGLGWYRITFNTPSGESPLEIAYAAVLDYTLDQGSFLAFAIIPKPLPIEQRSKEVGIDSAAYAQGPALLERSVELAWAAGVSWCRERLSWPRVNPEPGVFDWQHDEALMQLYARRGIKLMNVFHQSPKWTHRDKTARYPDDLAAAYRFGVELAEKTREHVFGWEIWNEQDIAFYGGGMPDHYAAMAKAISLGPRSMPNAPLVGNGAFARRPNVFNEIMWENELTHYLDAYNFHGYVLRKRRVLHAGGYSSEGGAPSRIREARKMDVRDGRDAGPARGQFRSG